MRRKITGKIAAGKRFAEERPTEKRCLSVLLALAVVFGACSAALTADAKDIDTGSGFQSYGKITYQNGDDVVVIDSEDFKKLADRLDLFKCRVVNQLNSMNTYFTTGDGIPLQTEENIHIVHTGPSGENCVDPKEIDLNALVEGIAASQSVPLGVTADNILHQRVRRNPHLIRIMHDLNLMEGEGSGYDLIYELNALDVKQMPILYSDFNSVTVTQYAGIINRDLLPLFDYVAQNFRSLSQKNLIALGLIARNEKVYATVLLIFDVSLFHTQSS